MQLTLAAIREARDLVFIGANAQSLLKGKVKKVITISSGQSHRRHR